MFLRDDSRNRRYFFVLTLCRRSFCLFRWCCCCLSLCFCIFYTLSFLFRTSPSLWKALPHLHPRRRSPSRRLRLMTYITFPLRGAVAASRVAVRNIKRGVNDWKQKGRSSLWRRHGNESGLEVVVGGNNGSWAWSKPRRWGFVSPTTASWKHVCWMWSTRGFVLTVCPIAHQDTANAPLGPTRRRLPPNPPTPITTRPQVFSSEQWTAAAAQR